MAFVPLFRPWFGVLGVALIRMLVLRKYVVYVVAAIFVLLYRYISEEIYSFYYGKLKIHEIIVNFSVLFGIYSFGITGILYGPLIVILYSCVEKELLANYGEKGNEIPSRQPDMREKEREREWEFGSGDRLSEEKGKRVS